MSAGRRAGYIGHWEESAGRAAGTRPVDRGSCARRGCRARGVEIGIMAGSGTVDVDTAALLPAARSYQGWGASLDHAAARLAATFDDAAQNFGTDESGRAFLAAIQGNVHAILGQLTAFSKIVKVTQDRVVDLASSYSATEERNAGVALMIGSREPGPGDSQRHAAIPIGATVAEAAGGGSSAGQSRH